MGVNWPLEDLTVERPASFSSRKDEGSRIAMPPLFSSETFGSEKGGLDGGAEAVVVVIVVPVVVAITVPYTGIRAIIIITGTTENVQFNTRSGCLF